jgi:hypothetical protein
VYVYSLFTVLAPRMAVDMLPRSRKAHVGRRRGIRSEDRARAEEGGRRPVVGAPGREGERGRRALLGRPVILPHGGRQQSVLQVGAGA